MTFHVEMPAGDDVILTDGEASGSSCRSNGGSLQTLEISASGPAA